MSDYQRCSRCGHFQPQALFHVQRTGKRGQTIYNAWCKPCRRTYSLARRRSIRAEVIAAYGGRCVCCGETTVEFLTIDHVRGGGGQQRKALGLSGSNGFYEWLRRQGYPTDDFRCLCMNCNLARSIYAHCPHDREPAHATR